MNTRCIMQQLAAAEAGWKVGPRSQLHWGWTWGPHDNIACCYKLGCPCLHLRPTEIHPSLSQFVLNFASLRCPAQSPSPKPAWRRDSWTSSSRRSSSCRRTTPWASSVAPRCAGSGVASSSFQASAVGSPSTTTPPLLLGNLTNVRYRGRDCARFVPTTMCFIPHRSEYRNPSSPMRPMFQTWTSGSPPRTSSGYFQRCRWPMSCKMRSDGTRLCFAPSRKASAITSTAAMVPSWLSSWTPNTEVLRIHV